MVKLYQTATKELFQKYMNPVFIETGTYMGDGVQLALDAGFKKIYSIELTGELYEKCMERFKGNTAIHLIHGDSYLVLDDLLKLINEPITFWLDGHFAGPGTSMGKYESPLMQELEAIGRHSIKTHTLLIDDLRCWSLKNQGFNTKTIMNKCFQINHDYKFTFENGYVHNDILAVRV